MPRLLRIGVSFVVVLVGYWSYALVVVPLIEPAAVRQDGPDRFERDRQAARQEMQRRLRDLEGLFPPDSWVLHSAKILQSDQVKLLIRDYTNLGGGRVEIRPCALVYTPSSPALSDAQRRRQSVVLEAPEGALLEFDGPFDLSRAKIGRLVKGQLKGRILIRSDNRQPGPQDDLLVVARDLDITEKQVCTPHDVEFRYGPNYGRGRQMTIKLLPGDPVAAASGHAPNIGGVEWFELAQLDRLHLEFADQGLLPAPSAFVPGAPGSEPMMIEVACKGPFRFSPTHQVITFDECVDVLRLHPKGPSDQLNCEALAIHLARPRSALPEATVGNKKNPGPLDLRPRRIEARGRPVVVRAPSQEIEVRGERMEYDFLAGRILLEGQGEVVLRQGISEIHAASVHYQSAGPGRLGQVAAQGPGWLRGRLTPQATQLLEAHWAGQLHIRPDQQRQVVSLTGSAALSYGAVGRLSAGEIHLWFFESPSAGQVRQSRLRPDRMLARQQVRLQSQQLAGAIDQFEVWFEPAAAQPQGGSVTAPATTAQIPAAALEITGAATASDASQPQFEIQGNLLRCRVLIAEPNATSADLAELVVEGNVRLRETQTVEPDAQPLLVTGQRIHVAQAAAPSASVSVTGSPAHFEYRGLGMTGTNINLNRGTNRVWIDGAGQMDLRVDRDLQGGALAAPEAMTIQWQRQMAFDGRTAHFEESVVAFSPRQQLRTESLDVSLQQSVRFDAEAGRQQPRLEKILCVGGVWMENQMVSASGPLAHDTLEAADMTANLITGDVRASGPGSMTSVRARGDARAARPPLLRAKPPNPAGPADGRLLYLKIRFQGALAGNLHRREMAFQDQVKTTYGTVASWGATLDPDDPDGLGPEGLLLSCQRMTVVEMAAPGGQPSSMELEASGNTLVEGRAFTARAARMSYAEAKDLLVLEGDGRTDAELSAQKYVGGPVSNFAARKILYWPSANRLSVDGVRWMEMNDLPTLGSRPKP